ncbi:MULTISPECIES: hypothetical protein [unclassified Micromonospora]|uniref:hypothetical protein n=1 Tax=unclassified Micromonospora TaxID=2617518 RepID=UPI0022CCF9FF|nr:hypothetical protein [Micromonospora sp. AKA38]GHJ14282.1 hypothetical protein TPA0908_22770 [Micromonospora sp. AKA38]
MKNKKLILAGAGAALAGGLLLAVPLTAAAADPGSTTAAKSQAAMAPMSQRTGTSVSVSPGANGVATVTCPSGTIVTGGGGQTSAFDIFITDSFASGNGWAVRGSNRGATVQTIRAVAICIG